MIKLEVWIDGIYSTAELVAEDGLFERVWLKNDTSITSITEPDELFEQIFDGLDADAFEKSEEFKHQLDYSQQSKISLFLQELRKLEEFIKTHNLNDEPLNVLSSLLWAELKIAAKKLKLH